MAVKTVELGTAFAPRAPKGTDDHLALVEYIIKDNKAGERLFQSLMQRRSIFFIEPVSGIERREFEFSSPGQIGRVIVDKPTGLHSSPQSHATTVAPVPRSNKVL